MYHNVQILVNDEQLYHYFFSSNTIKGYKSLLDRILTCI